MISYSFVPHPPCYVYDCSKCPYLDYPYCTYRRKMEEKGEEINSGVKINEF